MYIIAFIHTTSICFGEKAALILYHDFIFKYLTYS